MVGITKAGGLMCGSEMAVEPHAGVVAGEDAEGRAVWCLESWNRRRKIELMKKSSAGRREC